MLIKASGSLNRVASAKQLITTDAVRFMFYEVNQACPLRNGDHHCSELHDELPVQGYLALSGKKPGSKAPVNLPAASDLG